ncbi:MAG: DUF1887 family CARF protein [Paludibacteraceae bacterium]|nr:DUF1887 family CARF protein [Paludibacteraceae bacterium]
MAKTIVNIVTEDDPISAYLFIKEMFQEGDRLMYISAKDTESDMVYLDEIDGVPTESIVVLLKEDTDAFCYEKICRTVKAYLQEGVHYCVNLAGGTRYMALAVQQVFERFDSEFFYVHVKDNVIIKSIYDDSIYDDDDSYFPISYRMTIQEYLTAHGMHSDLKRKGHTPIRSEEDAKYLFYLFSEDLLGPCGLEILDILRKFYRCKNKVAIQDIISPQLEEDEPIPDIVNFLAYLHFTPQNPELLTKEELEYLTGGWFEEYVYYMMKRELNPDDIAIGVKIYTKGVKRQNELDVVFTKGNKFYVVECKTGVQTESIFNEIVYKACALKEALLGVSCLFHICTLRKDNNGEWGRIAKNMDIEYMDFECMTTESLLKEKLSSMKVKSKDVK